MTLFAENVAETYSSFEIEGTSSIAFRVIPNLISKYVRGNATLDFGCGSGRSTRFLNSLGMNVIGVDKCSYFLQKAIKTFDGQRYELIKNNKIPFANNHFNFIFSSFVFLMIKSRREMKLLCKELNRVLKKDGICIIITGSEHMHCPDKQWVSYETNFPENFKMSRGSPVKLKIKSVNTVFQDYNWFDEDYKLALENSGFKILETISPYPLDNKKNDWLSETTYSPFLIYVAKKIAKGES
ncbi:MAG: Ubiquinone/menaquinone biosynthesis C-methyltransferase UbiE [Chlamydiae bacterium]|nr:Ubiquinone/menaquinone biosynthesis C-methyltransferase UbiE [Chlamydiota bacterium]